MLISAFTKPVHIKYHLKKVQNSIIEEYVEEENRIAEIKPLEFDNYRQFGINRLKILLGLGVIKSPLFLFLVSYDLIQNDWRHAMPIYFPDSNGDTIITKFVYYKCS